MKTRFKTDRGTSLLRSAYCTVVSVSLFNPVCCPKQGSRREIAVLRMVSVGGFFCPKLG